MEVNQSRAMQLTLWASMWLALPSYAADALPTAAFMALPQVEQLSLSPDGRHLAMVINQADKSLVVTQGLDGSGARAVTGLDQSEGHFESASWFTPDRLSLRASVLQAADGRWYPYSRPMAINVDGSKAINLAWDRGHSLLDQATLRGKQVAPAQADGSGLMMEFPLGSGEGAEVYRIDTRTGSRELAQAPLKGLSNWRADRQRRIRLASRVVDGVEEFWGRGAQGDDWRVLWKQASNDPVLRYPVRFADDATLLEIRRVEAGKTSREWVRQDQPLVAVAAPTEPLRHSGERQPESAYEEVRRTIAEAFPQDSTLLLDLAPDGAHYLFRVDGDARSPTTFLGATATGTVSVVAQNHPQLASVKFDASQWIEMPAAADQPAWSFKLIRPQAGSSGALPVVLRLVPEGDDATRLRTFDPEGRWLAAQGMAVLSVAVPHPAELRPYRLTVERVRALRDRAHRQLGQIQTWLTEQPWADPQRICVVGQDSWASYAALSVATRAPTGLRCIVAKDAVTQPSQQFNMGLITTTSDGSYGTTTQRGIVARSDDVQALSLTRVAREWQVPVLLAHARRNTHVPPSHSQDLADVLSAAKLPVKVQWLARSDQYWRLESERLAAYDAELQFLRSHLGLATTTSPASQLTSAAN